MPRIFMDESGQFKKNDHEQYFVVASFTVGNPRRTEKQFRSWQLSKFPRRIRTQTEVKFSEAKIDENLRLKTLRFISSLDVRIHFSYLLRKNIPDQYRQKEKLQSGLLYTNIIGETLEMYCPVSEHEFRVFCDQRHLTSLTRLQFKDILKARLQPQLPSNALIQIEMLDSTTSPNIQIADWIAGALAWHLEKKKLGEACYHILKNNLLGEGKELFKDYWQSKTQNPSQIG